jgi:hypothetical protein
VVPITSRSTPALADDRDACGTQQRGGFGPGVSVEQREGLARRPGRVSGQLQAGLDRGGVVMLLEQPADRVDLRPQLAAAD